MSTFSKLNQQFDIQAEPHKFKWWHIPLLIILVAGTWYIINERNAPTQTSYQTNSGYIFGTEFHITYKSNENLLDSIDAVLNMVDNSLSPFNENSIITAINNNKPAMLNQMFITVFNMAKEISVATDGAFDITVAPLVNAWGFGFKNKENITDNRIQDILKHIGINKVWIENDKIVKSDTCVILDCSAIAKGYGVDAVGLMLERNGVHDYMVEIGGEVRVRGMNTKSTAWQIGINKPDDDSLGIKREIQEILSITDISIATSGNYRNFYEDGNKKYAHTIDPHTGYPAQQDILSSTVIAKDCALADAYATAFMVMGKDKAITILKQHPEIMAYFITADKDGNYTEWHSKSLDKYIKQ
ncbi:MAG: FAD:protein FMN transferase [Bacteroidaceae bacterium]|nr:FAD:protein FMN transferase [Bacteroidaceae bacterium]